MARKKYLEHLARVPMFSACSKKELEQVGRMAEELDIPQGYELITQGTAGQEFFVLVEGKAQVTRDGKDVATLGPGDFFGELALLDKAPRAAAVTAASPMRVYVLTTQAFNSVLAASPSLSRKLMVGMARRLHEAYAKA